MSKTDKIKAIGASNRSVTLIVAGAVVVLALLCMLPLYMQNRINSLYETAHGLQVEIAFLKHDALALELKINQLSSLEKLSKFADSVGLGLNGLPQKVMPIGGVQ
jgi:cell division protein FtsL